MLDLAVQFLEPEMKLVSSSSPAEAAIVVQMRAEVSQCQEMQSCLAEQMRAQSGQEERPEWSAASWGEENFLPETGQPENTAGRQNISLVTE